jgi:hydrogenase maturation protein HypF
VLRADWEPLLDVLCEDSRSVADRAAEFHDSLAATAVAIWETVSARCAVAGVGATGGVMQNRLLANRMSRLFAARGVALALPGWLPANDAGIAFGQLVEVAARGRLAEDLANTTGARGPTPDKQAAAGTPAAAEGGT